MDATLHVRFELREGEAADKDIRHLRFTRQDYYLPPEFAAGVGSTPAFLPEDIFTGG